jgi:hypothetical protein
MVISSLSILAIPCDTRPAPQALAHYVRAFACREQLAVAGPLHGADTLLDSDEHLAIIWYLHHSTGVMSGWGENAITWHLTQRAFSPPDLMWISPPSTAGPLARLSQGT